MKWLYLLIKNNIIRQRLENILYHLRASKGDDRGQKKSYLIYLAIIYLIFVCILLFLSNEASETLIGVLIMVVCMSIRHGHQYICHLKRRHRYVCPLKLGRELK